MDPLWSQINKGISQFGWFAIGVFGTEEHPVSFTYSIGLLETYGAPEVVIAGMPNETAHSVLSSYVNLLDTCRNKQVPTNERLSGIIRAPYECMLVDAAPVTLNHMPFARKRAQERGIEFAAQQLYWPDVENRLPQQLECDAATALSQVIIDD